MKPQIVVIHGGMVYDSRDAYLHALREDPVDATSFQRREKWKDALQRELEADFEVFRPEMPSPGNAMYEEWSIWFSRLVPFLRDGVILVGHSLGGIFLARYLDEHDLPVKVKATVLIAAPFDDESNESLGEFRITSTLEKFARQGGGIHLLASADDPVVPFAELKKYTSLLPSAQVHPFEDRGHFSLVVFPELSGLIRGLF
jgi:predicted alpha/beta hydrolase family esterase